MKLNKRKGVEEVTLEMQVAPLIDVVFLLLIYFMVTASLIKKEGDISFLLPAPISEPMNRIPVEAMIAVQANGTVELEGMQFAPDDLMLDDLMFQVAGLREIATSQQAPFSVTLTPHHDARHIRVIDVMDACAAAGVTNLSFGKFTL